MNLSTTPLADIDLADPDTYLEGVPHELFARLRHEAPVHFNPQADGPGFWVLTRYDDIRTVHRDAETFSSELGGVSLEDLDPDQLEARKSMLDMDPPRHDELRAMVARRFTPRSVVDWEEQVRRVTVEALDRALERGGFDFVEDVSSEIPMQVFAEIMGVPPEDRREIVELGNQLIGGNDPEYDVKPDERFRLYPLSNPVSLEIFEFGRRIAAARREDPREDIVSRLALEGLSQSEFDNYFLLLMIAGNETTRHTVSHGLVALLEHPEQLERLRHDPSLLDGATEEMLRWATPIYQFRRTTTRDVEIDGVEIGAGEKVTTWFISGNFDEEVFSDPLAFDISRAPNRHMAFGPGGIHHCMGAHLARLEIKIAFEELLARTEEIELAGPPERLRSNFVNGIKRLPVRAR